MEGSRSKELVFQIVKVVGQELPGGKSQTVEVFHSRRIFVVKDIAVSAPAHAAYAGEIGIVSHVTSADLRERKLAFAPHHGVEFGKVLKGILSRAGYMGAAQNGEDFGVSLLGALYVVEGAKAGGGCNADAEHRRALAGNDLIEGFLLHLGIKNANG